MSTRAQTLKGHLDVLLLATLESSPRHGYAVKEALRLGSEGRLDLPTGTIYPALHRLETSGLVVSDWSIVAGRRRRSYRLTPLGIERLHSERGQWHEFAATITALLTPQRHPSTTNHG